MCKLKTIDVKGRPYVEVNERIKAFRSLPEYKGFSLETEIISLENGVVTMKATIKDADSRVIATGFAQEKENGSYINKTSYIENCETSAWGRALGNLGIGIDTSIASADEVINAVNNQKEPNINNDIDIFEGLTACSDMENLKIYYKQNYKHVTDKKGFEELKDKLKATMIQ